MKSRKRIVRFYNWQDWRANASASEGLGGWLGSNVSKSWLKYAASIEVQDDENEVWLLAASKDKIWRISAWIQLRKRLPTELKNNNEYSTLAYYDIDTSLLLGDITSGELLEIPEIDKILQGYGNKLEQQGMAGFEFEGKKGKEIFNIMSSVSGTPFRAYTKNADYDVSDAAKVSLARPLLSNKVENYDAEELNSLSSVSTSVDNSGEPSIITENEASDDNSKVGENITAIQSELESAALELNSQFEGFKGVAGKDVDAIAKRRVGQGLFRRLLMAKHGSRCCLTGLENTELLIASHIVPWSKSNPYQKTDSENGLLLSVNWDAIFDKGLIAFDEQGNLICSTMFDNESARLLGIPLNAKLPTELLTDQRRENLAWHRDNVYRHEAANSDS